MVGKFHLLNTRMSSRYKGFEFYSEVLKNARYIVAPMVDQSELAWRLLSRELGAQLCYTPMYHAGIFLREPMYRKVALASCDQDRPLILQFCANDPDTFLQAAMLAEKHCDAIDLNLGCPQNIARRVSLAAEKLSIPITCKIRVFEDIQKTVDYAQMLEKAGCQLLTVHGRTREQKKELSGLASWQHIKAIKDNVSIPVFANGNILYFDDLNKCLNETGADGVMIAEGNLRNPSLFINKEPCSWEMAERYLQLVDQYPSALSAVRAHMFKLWHHGLGIHTDIRERLSKAGSVGEMKIINKDLKERAIKDRNEKPIENCMTPNKKPYWICQPFVRSLHEKPEKIIDEKAMGEKRSKSQLKKILKRQRKEERGNIKNSFKWERCERCKVNPKGKKCIYILCRACCKEKTMTDEVNCASHRFRGDRKLIINLTTQSEADPKISEVTAVMETDIIDSTESSIK